MIKIKIVLDETIVFNEVLNSAQKFNVEVRQI